MSKDAAYWRAYNARRNIEGRPRKDNRVNRHRTDKRDKGKKNKWQHRNIVAWDGEGANLDSGEHVYNLLANSFGHHILNHEGLSTVECFNFMLRDSVRSAINVIYGGSYDINMMLRDVPHDKLIDLWNRGHTYWGQYGISYAHRKRFAIRLFDQVQGKRRVIKSMTLWDVLGFFQKSFVESCRLWFKEFTHVMPILDEIEQMKHSRSTFSVKDIDEIIIYNKRECDLLVLLMKQLFAALDEADIKLIRYDGAGAIAASLMRRSNILSHGGTYERRDADCPPVYQWAQYAYSGGRIEAIKVGNLDSGKLFRYDINSAYPSATLNLPSLAGATYSFDPTWDGNNFSMVEIEWDYRNEAPFYPLWYREHDGSIIYPRAGIGRYWGYEAALLRDYYEEGVDYWIKGACNIVPATDAKPFNFVQRDYNTRARFKEEDNMASEALKLGLNSLYGKMAQQAGYRNGRIPTYHNLLWAGAITAATRARMFRAAMQHPKSVIAFATDAIISLREHDVRCGKGLGEWTAETLDGITIVQAGVYWLKYDGEWYSKYRGFDKGSLAREQILQCWATNETYRAELTRFYGMGSAIGTNNFKDYWRVWRTEPRELDLVPKGKRCPTQDTFYHERLCDTTPALNYGWDSMSMPYPIAWGLLAGVNLRTLYSESDIDVRIEEEEYLDSYA